MKIGYIIIEQFKCIAKENYHLKGFYYTIYIKFYITQDDKANESLVYRINSSCQMEANLDGY